MSRSVVSFFPRVSPRVIALTLIALGAAGCSDSQRFDSPFSNPFSSRGSGPEATGSISSRPMPPSHVASQPLPPPGHPTNIASTGVAGGGRGAYRPAAAPEVTGSVSERHAASAGHWTWDGGKAITVGQGETIETLARKYGVPASALMRANGMTHAAWLRPGQRLVIPRYVAGNTETRPEPSRRAKAAEGNVHVVAPGETLIGIARKHGMSLAALARANKISAYTKLSVGDHITIPGGHHVVAERPAPAPAVHAVAHAKAEHHAAAVETVASVPTQSVRLATPEPAETQSAVKTAEAAGAMPSFRWPVHGRIISAFGAKPNGQQNDGINLAVPEGTPIKAADDGVVAYAGNELKGYGNLVLIRHSNGYVSAYANASQLLVKRGDKVRRGQVIAHAGQTGNVTSPQLHFEIRKGSVPVDPAKFLSGA
ncbi:MAG TPA: LysM peptidoglycan-binding domain-containing M23 family metallopeptidase [Pseudolabrys sp.]|nr:LysM peptidoglycan-binding domain-containing M23 family metallopeptidase [Pseudolabrys sp.]